MIMTPKPKLIKKDILVLETDISRNTVGQYEHDIEDLLLDLPSIKEYAERQVGHIDSVFIRAQDLRNK